MENVYYKKKKCISLNTKISWTIFQELFEVTLYIALRSCFDTQLFVFNPLKIIAVICLISRNNV